MKKNKYTVHVEFTTVNTGSRFTARSADVCLESELSIDELWIEVEVIKQLCINFILSKRPTFKIFMIDIKTITENGKSDDERTV